jgi:hypothetical protein
MHIRIKRDNKKGYKLCDFGFLHSPFKKKQISTLDAYVT